MEDVVRRMSSVDRLLESDPVEICPKDKDGVESAVGAIPVAPPTGEEFILRLTQEDAGREFFLLTDNDGSSQSANALARSVAKYDTEGYSSMTNDTVRNRVYKAAIDEAIAQGNRSFFEVGCGKNVCLTRLVLDHAGTHIIALEGNPASAAAAALQLRAAYAQPHSRAQRWAVLSTVLSTAIESTELDAAFAADAHEVVLQELLGFIASREGVADTIFALQRRMHRLHFGDGRAAAAAPAASAAAAAMVNLCSTSKDETVLIDDNATAAPAQAMSPLPMRVAPAAPVPWFIPASTATFYTLTAFQPRDLAHNKLHKHCIIASTAPPYVLVSRLRIEEIAVGGWTRAAAGAGGGDAAGSANEGAGDCPACGCLEFLSFAEPMQPQLVQRRSATFICEPARGRSVGGAMTAAAAAFDGADLADAPGEVTINSISVFIWAGFGAPPTNESIRGWAATQEAAATGDGGAASVAAEGSGSSSSSGAAPEFLSFNSPSDTLSGGLRDLDVRSSGSDLHVSAAATAAFSGSDSSDTGSGSGASGAESSAACAASSRPELKQLYDEDDGTRRAARKATRRFLRGCRRYHGDTASSCGGSVCSGGETNSSCSSGSGNSSGVDSSEGEESCSGDSGSDGGGGGGASSRPASARGAKGSGAGRRRRARRPPPGSLANYAPAAPGGSRRQLQQQLLSGVKRMRAALATRTHFPYGCAIAPPSAAGALRGSAVDICEGGRADGGAAASGRGARSAAARRRNVDEGDDAALDRSGGGDCSGDEEDEGAASAGSGERRRPQRWARRSPLAATAAAAASAAMASRGSSSSSSSSGCGLAFSSLALDGTCASNWANLVLMLPRPLTVPAGAAVLVETTADLRREVTTYKWRLRVLLPADRGDGAGASSKPASAPVAPDGEDEDAGWIVVTINSED